MKNWALLVGIDSYERKELALQGAVQDALRVREWLLSPEGGNVPATNIFTALAYDGTPPITSQIYPPRKNEIVKILDRIVKKGPGERFFFYFSGHGMLCRGSKTAVSIETVMLFSDYSDITPDSSLSVESLRDYMSVAPFQDQFFIIDACRSKPLFAEPYECGRIPKMPAAADETRTEVQQFVLFAVPAGKQAIELRSKGSSYGAFTGIFLKGVNGYGNAKAYDEAQGDFVVRWDRLTAYVREETQSSIGQTKVSPESFVPEALVKRGVFGRDPDPILARLKPESFSPVSLRITVNPEQVAQNGSDLNIYEIGLPYVVAQKRTPKDMPVSILLPPRNYSVIPNAEGHMPVQRCWLVDLHEDYHLSVSLKPADPGSAKTGAHPRRTPQHQRQGVEPNNRITAFTGLREHVSSIDIYGPEKLSLLLLLDGTGKILWHGHGNVLRVSHLRPGLYSARIVKPEGGYKNEQILLGQGENQSVPLIAPPRNDSVVMRELIDAAGFEVLKQETLPWQNCLEISRRLGPMVAAELSTIITLASYLSTCPSPDALGWGRRLSSLGFEGLPHRENESGSWFQAVFCDEFEETIDWPGIKIRLNRSHGISDTHSTQQEAFPRPLEGKREFAQVTIRVEDRGAHIVTLEMPIGKVVHFPAYFQPGRIVLYVFHRTTTSNLEVFQYNLPSVTHPNVAEITCERLREMELVQRYCLNGQYLFVQEPGKYIKAEWGDPIGSVLGAYLELKRIGGMPKVGTAAILKALVEAGRRLANELGMGSDGHLITAEALILLGEVSEAKTEFKHAVECGYPIFSGGLTRLHLALKKYKLRTKRSADIKRAVLQRVPGLIWTGIGPGVTNGR